jgi:5-formyltetrahydrofolate cyclo-ligase
VTTTGQRAAKDALRARMVALRAGTDPAAREAASRAIAARLSELPAWRSARTVALYAPLGAEVDTREIARLAVAAGKRLAWPRLARSGRAMEFACCAPAELVPGPARALEPPASAPALAGASIDLVVVPGVAFDPRGGRLGRGRGHYDATLAGLPASVARLGVAFDAQVVEGIPAEPHDVPLDGVVTETRVLLAADRQG